MRILLASLTLAVVLVSALQEEVTSSCPSIPTRLESLGDSLGFCFHENRAERRLCQSSAITKAVNRFPGNAAYQACIDKVRADITGNESGDLLEESEDEEGLSEFSEEAALASQLSSGDDDEGEDDDDDDKEEGGDDDNDNDDSASDSTALAVEDSSSAAAAGAGCGKPLGFQSGAIRASQFRCSSFHPARQYHCDQARLHNSANHYWHTSPTRFGEWIQIDLLRPTSVSAIATQAGAGGHMIYTYQLLKSNDGNSWTKIRSADGSYVFSLKMPDFNNPVKRYFSKSETFRYIRLVALTYTGCQGLRMELYSGCATGPRVCDGNLGLGSMALPDSAFSTSATRGANSNLRPAFGRLDEYRGGAAAWMPLWRAPAGSPTYYGKEWLQVDLGRVREVDGVATQPRGNVAAVPHSWSNERVTAYNLEVSVDGTNWAPVTNPQTGTPLFRGNAPGAASNVVVKNSFGPVSARFVRLVPVTFIRHASLRMELYDSGRCRPPRPPPPPPPAPKRVMRLLRALAKPKPSRKTIKAIAKLISRPHLVSRKTDRFIKRRIEATRGKKAARKLERRILARVTVDPCAGAKRLINKVLKRGLRDAQRFRVCASNLKFKRKDRRRRRRRRQAPAPIRRPARKVVVGKGFKASRNPPGAAIDLRRAIRDETRNILRKYFDFKDNGRRKINSPATRDPYNPHSAPNQRR